MLLKFFYIIIFYCLYAIQIDAQSEPKNTLVKVSGKPVKNQLVKIKTNKNNSEKNKIVRLRIIVLDDSTKLPLTAAAVNIVRVDSVNTITPALAKSQDTANLFYALLSRDKNYFLTVNDRSYNAYRHKFSIRSDTAKIVKLKKTTDTAKNSDNTKPVSKAHNFQETNTIQKFIPDHIPFFVSLLLIFMAGVLYTITLVKAKAKFKQEYTASHNAIAELEENIKTKDAMIDMLNTNLSAAESAAEQIKKEQPDTLVAEQNVPSDTADSSRYFICEILMTAGPRKKFMSEPDADKDLGEDVCGFVSDTKKVLLWVLDGTSDLHCLKNPADNREYFSSRLLAQFFAEKLRKNFTEVQEKEFDEIVTKATEEVKNDFLEQIDQLPDDEKFFLKKNIANKNFPECATTILIASLDLNGDFTAYRSGDSKMFLFSSSSENEINIAATSLATKNEQSNDRLFFRLVLDANDKFDIFFNQLNYEIVSEKNISTIISFSDGVGMNTEQLLKDDYKRNPQQIRKEIIYQLQGTGDDKSICFIEIKDRK